MIKLKDLLNQKTNKNNKQISFDLKKRQLCKFDLNVDDILNLEIKKEKHKWH